MNTKIGFATCAKIGGLTPDDDIVAEFLRQNNFIVDALQWNDPNIHWPNYDAVILRSTWDYHLKLQQFLQWISELENYGIPLWNPPDVIRANVSKRYLIDFQNSGILIVPTVFLHKGSSAKLENILKQNHWNQAIIKPDVSASAYRTSFVNHEEVNIGQVELEQILKESGALIQEYRSEIVNSGEWSLIFFQREFSHAVLKKPASNDFRVQEELGGVAQPAIPNARLMQQAENVLKQIEGAILYARVDGISVDDEFLLMELELIEPCLYFDSDPHAPERFCNAVETVAWRSGGK